MSADILQVPGIILILTGLTFSFIPAWLRNICVMGLPPLLLVHLWQRADMDITPTWLGFELDLLHLSPGGMLFASVFILALWGGGVFALRDASARELGAAFVYAGGAIGISLCGDWISLFCFWELMALASTFIVWCGGQKDSERAGMRYLYVHIAGGVVLLAGISALAAQGNGMEFAPLESGSLAYWLVLAGIIINAGVPPFSFWVADAYPQASASGMVFLSAFTTKTAVFVLLSAFPGESLLIPVGVFMAFYGIIYALLEHDIRRILAYSIVNQVGFMLVAVGVGTPETLNGAHAHAVAHILYKMALLMGAGTILRHMGTTDPTRLPSDLWRRLPLTAICILAGAAASMGVPFTSSFITKSVILSGLAHAELSLLWVLMLVCSAAVVFNAGMRFPWLALFSPAASGAAAENNSGISDPKGLPLAAMLGTALICVFLGWIPGWFYTLLPYPETYPPAYHPYGAAHLLEQIQILAVAGAVFWFTRNRFSARAGITLDSDWIFRVALAKGWKGFLHTLSEIYAWGAKMLLDSRMRSFMLIFSLHGPRGILARSWHTGSIALWVALMLASYILVYNFSAPSVFATLRRLLIPD